MRYRRLSDNSAWFQKNAIQAIATTASDIYTGAVLNIGLVRTNFQNF